MPTAQPFPAEGITLLLGSQDGGSPTKEWVGKPSTEDIELFLWFLFAPGNLATRRPVSSGHQTEQMQGNFCAYGLPTPGIRGTDQTRRVYAGVRLLELVGESNWEACRRVASYLEDRLGRTKRGRKPKTASPRDFLNTVCSVRSIYNGAKERHRWKEKLPERDLELEYWLALFLHFRAWAYAKHAAATEESQRRGVLIETLCQEIQARPARVGAVIGNTIRKIEQIRLNGVASRGAHT